MGSGSLFFNILNCLGFGFDNLKAGAYLSFKVNLPLSRQFI